MASKLLSEREKALISQKLRNRINSENELIIVSQTERTQFKNKQSVINKFFELIELALKPKKKRKATKPSRASKEKRLQVKHKLSQKKANRRSSEE